MSKSESSYDRLETCDEDQDNIEPTEKLSCTTTDSSLPTNMGTNGSKDCTTVATTVAKRRKQGHMSSSPSCPFSAYVVSDRNGNKSAVTLVHYSHQQHFQFHSSSDDDEEDEEVTKPFDHQEKPSRNIFANTTRDNTSRASSYQTNEYNLVTTHSDNNNGNDRRNNSNHTDRKNNSNCVHNTRDQGFNTDPAVIVDDGRSSSSSVTGCNTTTTSTKNFISRLWRSASGSEYSKLASDRPVISTSRSHHHFGNERVQRKDHVVHNQFTGKLFCIFIRKCVAYTCRR